MPQDDAVAGAPEQDDFAAFERELGGSVGGVPARLGGTVVAGPPHDAFEMAQQEILAALFGAPTPGAM